MKIRLILIVSFLGLLATLCSCTQKFSVTLTRENNDIKIDRPGTVTFKAPYVAHVDLAQKHGMKQISEDTFEAAVLFNVAFDQFNGYTHGKIFNMTEEPISVLCQFYQNDTELGEYVLEVQPRSFSRLINYDKYPEIAEAVSICDKIVCTEI